MQTQTKLKTLPLLLSLLALLALVACKPNQETVDKGNADGKTHIVATTTMISDLARQLGAEQVSVTGIMRPGGDPHLYTPTPADARIVARADIVLTNGLKLEGWLEDLVRNAGGKAQVVEVSKGVSALKDPNKTNYPDPHFWHDASLWKNAVVTVRDALVTQDPTHAKLYKERADAYLVKLDTLHEKIKKQIATIPKEHRTLVTSHDAFQYYGKAYGLEVIAVQGLSTESEAGAQDLARVIEAVRTRKLPALFVETSVNPKLIEQISKETGAVVGGTLFSDSLGESGTAGETYLEMLQANTNNITKALSGGKP